MKLLMCMPDRKAAGPSDVVAEMLKAAHDICCKITADLMNAIIFEGKVPADWSDSDNWQWKRDVLDRSNYRGLKLTDHVLKVIERLVKNITCDTINTDQMKFCFCPSWATTDAIFILRQPQEKYLT